MRRRETLLCTCLRDHPKRGLAGGENGSEMVKMHRFFVGIDFDRVYRCDIKPVFVPELGQKGDLSSANFDDVFTNEPAVDSVTSIDRRNVASEAPGGISLRSIVRLMLW